MTDPAARFNPSPARSVTVLPVDFTVTALFTTMLSPGAAVSGTSTRTGPGAETPAARVTGPVEVTVTAAAPPLALMVPTAVGPTLVRTMLPPPALTRPGTASGPAVPPLLLICRTPPPPLTAIRLDARVS